MLVKIPELLGSLVVPLFLEVAAAEMAVSTMRRWVRAASRRSAVAEVLVVRT